MNRLVSWIRSKVGCGYVYGATGWICTQARLEQQAAQYPEQAQRILTICPKWIGVQCFDCAQLIRQGLKEIGVSIPSGANAQWNADVWAQKGPIEERPERFCALYRFSGGRMQHTGWYLGNGETVDARGSVSGVVASTIDQYAWTHYAIPKGLPDQAGEAENVPEEFEPALYQAVIATQRDPLRLRSAPETGTVLGKMPRGATVDVLTQPEEGWQRVRWGALTGYASAAYLRRTPQGGD